MILWLIYIISDAVVNWYLIEKKKININHVFASIARWAAFVLIGISVPIRTDTLLPWTLYTTTSFWLFFDLILNLLRGRPWNYIGKNAVIDKFGLKHIWLYWLLKLIAVVVLIFACLGLL